MSQMKTFLKNGNRPTAYSQFLNMEPHSSGNLTDRATLAGDACCSP